MNISEQLQGLAARKAKADALSAETRRKHEKTYTQICEQMRTLMLMAFMEAVTKAAQENNAELYSVMDSMADAYDSLDVSAFLAGVKKCFAVANDVGYQIGFTDVNDPRCPWKQD